jgi:hypothetical protein
MPNSIGVPKMPGAMVMLRMPLCAGLRVISRIQTHLAISDETKKYEFMPLV